MGVSRRHAVHPVVRRRIGWQGVAPVLGSALAGAIVVAGLAAAAVAAAMVRIILIPSESREQDTKVLGVDRHSGTVTFSRSPDAIVDGRVSFWFSAATGHARIGSIVSETDRTVTRQLLGVDFGDLEHARQGRFNGWFYLYPSDLGVDYESVMVGTELGPAPAWLIRPAPEDVVSGGDRWVIQIHGRAVVRAETIRAVPVFRDAGYTSLLISYRNDFEAPSSADGRYSLGDTEWRDVDAALVFARNHGATSVVLMGWSMGGAIALQTVSRSPLAGMVKGLVLDSPVVNWVDALDFQGRSKGVIRPLRSFVYAMIGGKWGRPVTGLDDPIDFRRLDFVTRAKELTMPVLILHSDDDDYVPSSASHALAGERPDIVTLEVFNTARHTKLWNYAPERWTRAIGDWLRMLDAASAPSTAHKVRFRSPRGAG
ncbi:MAG: alpha/beta fold hydrolase [Terrimesophilobacter sp.]